MTGHFPLPADLPVPQDDGRADHVAGRPMPAVELAGTDGRTVALHELGPGRTLIYLYPMTGRPGVELPDGWDAIPGARGCTPESCGFRDLHAELQQAGAARVYGLSGQDTDYQREAAERLHLPFALLSDVGLTLADALDLPTFEVEGRRLYARLTLVVSQGRVEHAFYPVFPPDAHAGEVLAWLGAHGT
ncbi:MAG: peroxiredoxin [Jatrophihabitantaceae bacterium]